MEGRKGRREGGREGEREGGRERGRKGGLSSVEGSSCLLSGTDGGLENIRQRLFSSPFYSILLGNF